MKTLLTEFMATAFRYVKDEATGKSRSEYTQCKAHNVFMQCINNNLGMVGAEAALSRYIRILLDIASTQEAAADVAGQIRPKSVDASGAAMGKVSRFFQLIHAMFLDVEECISTAAIPNVETDAGEMFAREIERNLAQKLGVPPSNLGPRKTQFYGRAAREVCINEAIVTLLATSQGHDWLRKNNHWDQPWGADVIVGFISPMLKLQIHHVAYAYSLLSFQSVDGQEVPAMLAFALEAQAQNEQLRSFLILPPEDFQVRFSTP